MRGGLVLACVLGALDPSLPSGEGPRRRAVVLDVSASLARGKTQRRGWALDAVADLAPEDRATLILAGAAPRVATGPRSPAEWREGIDAALLELPAAHGSDLGAALREAGRVGPGGEVLLISDGRDTAGTLLPAARALGAVGVPVHVLGPDLPPPLGARLVRLDAPEQAAPRQRVRVEAEARTWRAASVELRLLLESEGALPQELARVRREVGPGDPLLLRAETPPLRRGLSHVVAVVAVSGPDDDPQDDARRAPIRVGDAARALVCGPAPPLPPGLGVVPLEAQELTDALASGPPPQLIVLSDVPAAALAGAVEPLRRAVESGCGLAVLGTGRAFGPGGYAGSPLEALLPVQSGPGQERERPLTLLVALDGSGSMAAPQPGAASRWDRAVEAGLPLSLLRPGDALGLVVFAGAAELVVPPGPPDPRLPERLIKRAPGGSTDLGAGVLRGLTALAGREGDLLLVAVSDAEDPHPERHLPAIEAAARALPAERLSVLLVRVAGPGAARAPAYGALARAIGPAARVVEVADSGQALRDQIEGELLARRAAVRPGPFPLRLTAEAVARGLRAPAEVTAYAPVRARAEGLVLVRAGDPELDEPPALVLGRRGAGAVLAAPVPAGEAGPLLAAALPALVPAARGARLALQRAQGDLLVQAEGDELPPGCRAQLEADQAAPRELALVRETPRRLRARVSPAPAGAVWVTLRAADGAVLAAAGLPGAGADELGATGPDWDALARVARASGGSVLPVLPGPERPLPRTAAPPAQVSARPLLAGLALLLLLIEAALGLGGLRLTAPGR